MKRWGGEKNVRDANESTGRPLLGGENAGAVAREGCFGHIGRKAEESRTKKLQGPKNIIRFRVAETKTICTARLERRRRLEPEVHDG